MTFLLWAIAIPIAAYEAAILCWLVLASLLRSIEAALHIERTRTVHAPLQGEYLGMYEGAIASIEQEWKERHDDGHIAEK